MVDGVAPLIIPYPETATRDQIREVNPENSFSISIGPLRPPLSTHANPRTAFRQYQVSDPSLPYIKPPPAT